MTDNREKKSEVKVYSPNEVATMWTIGATMPTGFISHYDYQRLQAELKQIKTDLHHKNGLIAFQDENSRAYFDDQKKIADLENELNESKRTVHKYEVGWQEEATRLETALAAEKAKVEELESKIEIMRENNRRDMP